MTKRSSKPNQIDDLQERALIFAEQLFDYWQFEWLRTGKYIFFKCTWRNDKTIGSAWINTEDGGGSDKASERPHISDEEIKKLLGPGATQEDVGYDEAHFNIIGICLRHYRLENLKDYGLARRLLERDLDLLGAPSGAEAIARARAEREARVAETARHKTKYVLDIVKDWDKLLDIHNDNQNPLCQSGLIYLEKYRGIPLQDEWGISRHEPIMKLLPSLQHSGSRKFFPCIVFKITDKPVGDGSAVKGIYRLYIARNGNGKAEVDNTKKPILKGETKKAGGGIWLGSKDERLWVCEGPEDALDLRYSGDCKFVCCGLDAGNLPTLKIPRYVKEVIICADNDKAGRDAAILGRSNFASQGKAVTVIFPSSAGDWNDHHYTKGQLNQLIISTT